MREIIKKLVKTGVKTVTLSLAMFNLLLFCAEKKLSLANTAAIFIVARFLAAVKTFIDRLIYFDNAGIVNNKYPQKKSPEKILYF